MSDSSSPTTKRFSDVCSQYHPVRRPLDTNGTPQPLLVWKHGATLLEWQCRLFSGLGPVVVVADPPLAERIMSLGLQDANLVFNHQPERGMFSSVLTGLHAVSSGVEGIMVQPVDCPLVDSRVPAALCHKAEEAADASVLVPTYRGKRGHPVWLAWNVALALRREPPTGSLREFLGTYPVTEVPVDAPEILANLNTPEDVRCWRNDGRDRP